jgi:DNA polymerase V
MLMDLQPATRQLLTLDLDADMPENRIRLMQAMDQVNRRFGRGSLVLGSAGGWGTAGLGDEAGAVVVGVYD